MRSFFILILLCIATSDLFAQSHGIVSGKIKDSKNLQAIEGSIISVMNLQDSTIRGGMTDKNGSFTIKNLAPAHYKLFASFFGYKNTTQTFTLTKEKPEHNLGDILLDSLMISLNEVTIIAEAPPIILKKDTVEFNAGSFKTPEHAVIEDVIKQLPGIEVDKDGSITTQGQKVTTVLVDGKPFFGNDLKMATKNLPAGIINKVQVIQIDPEKSENGLTGVIINLTVKKDKKKGIFGNTSAGVGTNNQYKGNLNVNRFNNEQQLSLMSSANSTDNEGGVSKIYTAAINFNNPIGKKASLSFSYQLNLNNGESLSRLYRNTTLQEGSLLYSDRSTNSTNSQNHGVNLEFEYKINPSSKLRVAPRINYRTSSNRSSNIFESLNNDQKVNDGDRSSGSDTKSPDFINTINYSKRFKNSQRHLMLLVTNSFRSNNQDGLNYSLSNYYLNEALQQTVINQKKVNNTSSSSNAVNIAYSEPVFKNLSIKLMYDFNSGIENSSRNTYDFNELSNEFDKENSLLSNVYRNRTNYNRLGLSLNSKRESATKMDYSVGVSVQKTDLRGKSLSKDSVYTQNKFSIIPQASLNYSISKNKSFGANYKGDIRQPAISDLQAVPDNSNPLYIRMGNPNLQPEFNNSIGFNFRSFNPASNQSMFANLNFTTVLNQITYSNIFDATTGKQISKPENVSGNYNLNLFVNWGLPYKKIQFKPGLNTAISKSISNINGVLSATINGRYGLLYGMNYRYNNKIDLLLNCNANYNNVSHADPRLKDAKYFNLSSNFNCSYFLPGNFTLSSDLTYTKNTSQIQSAKQGVTLLNASLNKEFLKGKKAKLSLEAFDLLNQNTNTSRSITNNQIEDRLSNTVRQYFMLSFTYRLLSFKG
ncbi:hypothetical protein C3K47_10405 [Solitalea longa]|uniref:Outer membrane protein beta-barrel domain-containing protein n=1 Tax=Solitalea longa TaxID=2079460 RepID=A0A2S5A2D7_9SPHI|nr:TonB-dependent receptor [Solitalea longa]POY36760.1 hypothetical protein C3K47_10405 [Solitalea longa]